MKFAGLSSLDDLTPTLPSPTLTAHGPDPNPRITNGGMAKRRWRVVTNTNALSDVT